MLNKKLVIKTYNQAKSYAATARIFGVSKQRIHQIVKNYNNTGKKARLKKYKQSGFFNKKCEICKKVNPYILHHKDFNNKNDSLENLQPVCKNCHILLHRVKLFGQGYKTGHRICTSCKKPFNYNFKHDGNGFCSKCYSKKYRLENKEYYRKYRKEYHLKNREKLLAKYKERYRKLKMI